MTPRELRTKAIDGKGYLRLQDDASVLYFDDTGHFATETRNLKQDVQIHKLIHMLSHSKSQELVRQDFEISFKR